MRIIWSLEFKIASQAIRDVQGVTIASQGALRRQKSPRRVEKALRGEE